LSVRIRDITKAGALASQLMDKGANSLEGIEFDYSQKDANTMAYAETPFATPCARPLATSMGSALSSAGPRNRDRTGGTCFRWDVAENARRGPARSRRCRIPVEPGIQTLRTEVQVTWELAQ